MFADFFLYQVCEKGTVCRYNSKGEGILRCFEPLNVGDACNNHGDCRNGQRCSKNLMKGRRCFNPKKALKQGDSCHPNASPDEKQCVETLKGPLSSFELKCLKNKEGKFVCHRLIGLGKACSVDKGKPDACDEGLSCVRHGKYDVCVDKSV